MIWLSVRAAGGNTSYYWEKKPDWVADVSFSLCSASALRIGTIVFEFEKWQSHLHCLASGKWAHISLTSAPSIIIPPQPEKFLCLLHPSLLTPSASPLCCWCNIMSVGEGMACLCAPEGLPTHCWEEKTTRAWMPLSPSLFKRPFTPTTTTMELGLCGTALFLSLTHPQTHKEGMVTTKTWGEDWVWFCVFSPHMLVHSDSSDTWDPNAIESLLNLPYFLVTTSLFVTVLFKM